MNAKIHSLKQSTSANANVTSDFTAFYHFTIKSNDHCNGGSFIRVGDVSPKQFVDELQAHGLRVLHGLSEVGVWSDYRNDGESFTLEKALNTSFMKRRMKKYKEEIHQYHFTVQSTLQESSVIVDVKHLIAPPLSDEYGVAIDIKYTGPMIKKGAMDVALDAVTALYIARKR